MLPNSCDLFSFLTSLQFGGFRSFDLLYASFGDFQWLWHSFHCSTRAVKQILLILDFFLGRI